MKRREKSAGPEYNKYEPAVVDMRTFGCKKISCAKYADSEIVMVGGTFWDDSFEQDRSWDDSGTNIPGI